MSKMSPRRERWRRDPRVGWFALTAVGLGILTLLEIAVILLPSAEEVDSRISAAVRSMRNPGLTRFALAVTQFGSPVVVISIATVTTIWLAYKRRTAAIVYLISTVAVGWFLGVVVVQNLVRRERPVGVNLIDVPDKFSLPSGHSLASFLLYASLAVIITLNAPTDRRMKRWVGGGAAVVIVCVGWSRVYLGVHWAGDVLAAWLFGGMWWAFTTATYLGSVTNRQREIAHDAR